MSIPILTGMLLALSGPQLSLPHAEDRPVDHRGLSRQLESRGDLEGALLETRRALHHVPGDGGSLEAVVRLARRSGDGALERAGLEELARRRPSQSAPLVRLARLLLEAGEDRAAWMEATVAIAREPEAAEAYQLRGRAELRLGMLEDATRDFESAVILDPRHGWAFNNLGLSLLRSGDPARAAGALEQAASLLPDEACVQLNLAAALEVLDRSGEALLAYGRALELDPGNTAAAAGYARLAESLDPALRGEAAEGEAAEGELPWERSEVLDPIEAPALMELTGKRPGDDLAGVDLQGVAEQEFE